MVTDDADADAAELARLDEGIAENDTRDGSNDWWRATRAVYDKAELIERLEDGDAALPLYVDVVQRLRGCREPGPRELLIFAMNDVAVVHYTHGREGESRSAARALVEEQFDDAPLDATEALVNGTLLLARLLRTAGAYDQALDLDDRLIERYGQPGVPDYRRTAAVANCEAATALWRSGRLEESLERFNGVIRELGNTVEPTLRQALAEAMSGKAHVLSEMDLPADRNAVCEEIVELFRDTEDAEIAESVAWAQMDGAGRVSDTLAAKTSTMAALMRSHPSALVAVKTVEGSRAAESWYALAHRLHDRLGWVDEAEHAYRRAIDGGYSDAWLDLGILLSAVPGREADEEHVFRMALGSETQRSQHRRPSSSATLPTGCAGTSAVPVPGLRSPPSAVQVSRPGTRRSISRSCRPTTVIVQRQGRACDPPRSPSAIRVVSTCVTGLQGRRRSSQRSHPAPLRANYGVAIAGGCTALYAGLERFGNRPSRLVCSGASWSASGLCRPPPPLRALTSTGQGDARPHLRPSTWYGE